MEWSLNNGQMTMLTMFDGNSRQPGDFGWDPMGLMSPANEVKHHLDETMMSFGYSIIKALVTDISPDARVKICVEIKILRRARAESSRRPPRHRRDACSMAWRCRFLTARPRTAA